MKSLILKDLYNISHNSKAMILILIIMGAFFIPMNGPVSYVALLFSLCGVIIGLIGSFGAEIFTNNIIVLETLFSGAASLGIALIFGSIIIPLIIIAFVLISVKISTRIFNKVELN